MKKYNDGIYIFEKRKKESQIMPAILCSLNS